MAKSFGRERTRAYFRDAPEAVMRVLRGAGRAAGVVIADGARERCISSEVRAAIETRVRRKDGTIIARVQIGDRWANSVGTWLEYGTDGHFISVDPTLAGGRSAGRINRLDRAAAKEGRTGPGATLVINGKPVGATVWHPGAQAHPFMRVSLDVEGSAAMAAAQAYIDARLGAGAKGSSR